MNEMMLNEMFVTYRGGIVIIVYIMHANELGTNRMRKVNIHICGKNYFFENILYSNGSIISVFYMHSLFGLFFAKFVELYPNDFMPSFLRLCVCVYV